MLSNNKHVIRLLQELLEGQNEQDESLIRIEVSQASIHEALCEAIPTIPECADQVGDADATLE